MNSKNVSLSTPFLPQIVKSGAFTASKVKNLFSGLFLCKSSFLNPTSSTSTATRKSFWLGISKKPEISEESRYYSHRTESFLCENRTSEELKNIAEGEEDLEMPTNQIENEPRSGRSMHFKTPKIIVQNMAGEEGSGISRNFLHNSANNKRSPSIVVGDSFLEEISSVCAKRSLKENLSYSPQSSKSIPSRSLNCGERKFDIESKKSLTSTKKTSIKNCFLVENFLQISILEAKGIPAKKNYFCEIYLDNVFSGKTSSKLKSDVCLWSETFNFEHLPNSFSLCVSVFRERWRKSRKNGHAKSSPIGCVHIPLQDISSSCFNEKWYPLELLTTNNSHNNNPHADVCQCGGADSTHHPHHQGTMYTVLNPLLFSSSLRDFPPSQSVAMCVKKCSPCQPPLLHDELFSKKSSSVFLPSSTNLPSIRIKARFQTLRIFPLKFYETFLKINTNGFSYSFLPNHLNLILTIGLLESLNIPSPLHTKLNLVKFLSHHYLEVCQFMEPLISVKVKQEVSVSFLRVFQSLNKSHEFLTDIILNELTKDGESESLTFRGNSISSKAMETYMKSVASQYLAATLGHFVTTVISSNASCEVDPTRIKGVKSELAKNQHNLIVLCENVWHKIITSTKYFPKELSQLFGCIRLRLISEGKGESIVENFISSCIFLRFLCPGILSPSLFGLVKNLPNPKASRNLTLIAKTIQTLANSAKFGCKENYMIFMNGFVERETLAMKTFLYTISTDIAKGSDSSTFQNPSAFSSGMVEDFNSQSSSSSISSALNASPKGERCFNNNSERNESLEETRNGVKKRYFFQKEAHNTFHFTHKEHHRRHHCTKSNNNNSNKSDTKNISSSLLTQATTTPTNNINTLNFSRQSFNTRKEIAFLFARFKEIFEQNAKLWKSPRICELLEIICKLDDIYKCHNSKSTSHMHFTSKESNVCNLNKEIYEKDTFNLNNSNKSSLQQNGKNVNSRKKQDYSHQYDESSYSSTISSESSSSSSPSSACSSLYVSPLRDDNTTPVAPQLLVHHHFQNFRKISSSFKDLTLTPVPSRKYVNTDETQSVLAFPVTMELPSKDKELSFRSAILKKEKDNLSACSFQMKPIRTSEEYELEIMSLKRKMARLQYNLLHAKSKLLEQEMSVASKVQSYNTPDSPPDFASSLLQPSTLYSCLTTQQKNALLNNASANNGDSGKELPASNNNLKQSQFLFQEEMKKIEKQKEENLKNIISRLILVEKELWREQHDFYENVEHKQNIIEEQFHEIQNLQLTNQKLLRRIESMKRSKKISNALFAY